MRGPFVRRFLLLLLVSLVLPGFAGAQSPAPLANPIANPGAPWPFAGFVVNVPELDDLYSLVVNRETAVIGKLVVRPARTWTFTALTQRPGRGFKNARALADHMRSGRKVGLDPARYTKLTHEEYAEEHLGQPCARYQIRALDRGAKGDASVPIQFRGLTCVHPEQPDLLVDLAYSELGGEGALSEVLTKAGGRFLESLRFLPIKAPPALRDALAMGRAGNVPGSLALLQLAAESGDTRAAAELGLALVEGRGVPPDPEASRKWLEAATKDGWIDALYTLGVVHDNGLGVPRDPVQAAKWWRLAADQRDAQAQFNLGVYAWNAENSRRDVKSACLWWERAAANGHAGALKNFKENRC
jgi:TPR repeat protein